MGHTLGDSRYAAHIRVPIGDNPLAVTGIGIKKDKMSFRRKPESECKTANLFRDFYGNHTFLEENQVLKEFGFKSKNNTGKPGYLDFAYTENEAFMIIVEAKGNTIKQDEAIDHIKHYMLYNSVKRDLIGMACSGQTIESLQINYFIKEQGSDKIIDLIN